MSKIRGDIPAAIFDKSLTAFVRIRRDWNVERKALLLKPAIVKRRPRLSIPLPEQPLSKPQPPRRKSLAARLPTMHDFLIELEKDNTSGSPIQKPKSNFFSSGRRCQPSNKSNEGSMIFFIHSYAFIFFCDKVMVKQVKFRAQETSISLRSHCECKLMCFSWFNTN